MERKIEFQTIAQAQIDVEEWIVSQGHDFTDLQSLENGNFIGWWYIEHDDRYIS